MNHDLTDLSDGSTLDLEVRAVRRDIAGVALDLLGYDGTIPGPALHVRQGDTITVNVTNRADLDTTVHWHGLRLDNRYDGVPGETQPPIRPGQTFAYRLVFPDPGCYWYHPHLREDMAQELGLYGVIVVEPADPGYWPPADRQRTITLDDLLVEDGRLAPFGRSGPNFVAMGRFGNVLLVNGDTELDEHAGLGEVVRLHLVNTANTRLFNVGVRGARMKLVGADSGRYEHETFVSEVLVAPSERAIVDVLFDRPGAAYLEHRTPDRVYPLGSFTVSGPATGTAGAAFALLRSDPELTAERAALEPHLRRLPDKTLALVATMPLLYGSGAAEATAYVCPMHPDVTATAPGTCPRCGMRLVPADAAPAPDEHSAPAHHDLDDHGVPDDAGSDGLEWEDLMPEINRASDPTNTIWQLVDRDTGAVNHRIDWRFTVGQRVKIRLVNEMDSDHPMHHPFHIHGAGRFLVLARNGVPEPNLAWKDTVLLRAGATTDILLHVTNPGRWMAHCHIAEHHEAGMMFSFAVQEDDPAA